MGRTLPPGTYFIICTLTVLQLFVKDITPAIVFYFPSHPGEVVTAAEDTEIRVPFGVHGLDDLQQDQLFISVYNSTGHSMLKICSIIYYKHNKSFMISDDGTICVNGSGPAPLTLRTRVSRWEDRNTLVWQAFGHQDHETTLTLNVTYPANINSFVFTGESPTVSRIVEEAVEPVLLQCLWTNGNPPSVARLLDGQRQVLAESDAIDDESLTHKLTYTLTSVNCSQSGDITCEAIGAVMNRTITLLVRCKPEFLNLENTPAFAVTRNTSVRMTYRVRAHTNRTEKCEIKKLQSATNRLPVFALLEGAVSCSLTGRPPDLTLTVVMAYVNDVVSDDETLWRLEVTNEKGTGFVDFALRSAEGDDSKTGPTTPNTQITIVVIGSSAGGGFVLLVIVIVVIVQCKRRPRRLEIDNANRGNEGRVSGTQVSRKSDSSAGSAAGNGSKSSGSTPRSSSDGSDKISSNPNYASTVLQEVDIHAYTDLHTRDPTYAATSSKKDAHAYMELPTRRTRSDSSQPPAPTVPSAEGSRSSVVYANQAKLQTAEEEEEEDVNYYNTA